ELPTIQAFPSVGRRANVWTPVTEAARRGVVVPVDTAREARPRNPPLDLTPDPVGTPLTFDGMARAYLEDYQLQCYRTMNTARPRVEHLRDVFGGWTAETVTADAVRHCQLPAAAGCGSGDDQSGDLGPEPHVSDRHSARAPRADAAVSPAPRTEPAAR